MQRRHPQSFVHLDDQLPAIVVLGARVARPRRDVPQPERQPAQPQRHRRAESQEAAEVARRTAAASHRRNLRQRQDGTEVSRAAPLVTYNNINNYLSKKNYCWTLVMLNRYFILFFYLSKSVFRVHLPLLL